MGSSFGQLFRISTFGESHGGGVGVIVDGCPPRLQLDLEAIQTELDRRKPGQSKITTPRKEDDRVEILSGLLDGVTLGTPIAMVVRNKDQRPQDYKEMEVAFRPSHADATYQAKYGIQARSGGGRASARETIGRVAAGAIAKQLLAKAHGTEVIAWVQRIHDLEAAIAWYQEVFGATVEHREVVDSDGVAEALLRVADSYVQLLTPTTDTSPVAKYLEKKGEGLHHVGYRVANCAAALEAVKASGGRVIDEQPRPGSRGTTVAFVHPKASFGTLIELVEDNGTHS